MKVSALRLWDITKVGLMAISRNKMRSLQLLAHNSAADVARDYEIDVRRVRLLPAGIAILVAVSALLRLPLHVARGGLREGVVLRLAEAQE